MASSPLHHVETWMQDEVPELDLSTLELPQKKRRICNSFRILVVGDGDFSYSVALAKRLALPLQGISFCATAFSSEISKAMEPHLLALKEMDAEVYHGVDAMKLQTDDRFAGRVFDRIVFNFPSAGRKITENRNLLAAFFIACAPLLAIAPDYSQEHESDFGGQVWVTLCSGQGGTPADGPRQRTLKQSWSVVEQAASAGFILVSVGLPALGPLVKEGYCPGGFRTHGEHLPVGRGIPSKFWNHARTHVFVKEGAAAARGARPLFPIELVRDISFFLPAEDAVESHRRTADTPEPVADGVPPCAMDACFERLCSDVCIGFGAELAAPVAAFDDYWEPETGNHARSYHVVMRSASRALNHARANEIVIELKAKVASGALPGAQKRRINP